MLETGIRKWREYKKYDVHFVNTVHDSDLLEVPNDPKLVKFIAEDFMAELEQVPIDYGITRIPFKADAKVGTRWGRGGQIGYDKWLKIQQEKGMLPAHTP